MSATSDFMTDCQLYTAPQPSLVSARTVLRLLQRIIGVSLIIAASGLWLARGTDWNSDIMLMKMGLSVVSLMVGFWLIFAGAKPADPEIEIDTVRQEIRVVRPSTFGAGLVLQRCGFAQMGRVQRAGFKLQFWDQRGNFIADVHVTEQRILDMMLSSLRDSGHAI